MTTVRDIPNVVGAGREKRSDTVHQFRERARRENVPPGGIDRELAAKNPPCRAGNEDQAASESPEEFHALLSWMDLASWMVLKPSSRWMAATGCDALH
jgi:hypothetical protein